MEFEYLILRLIQVTFGHEREIGDVLLILAAPTAALVLASHQMEGHVAEVLFLFHAATEPRVAGAEDRAQNAIARRPVRLASEQEAKPMAVSALLMSEGECFRSCPFRSL